MKFLLLFFITFTTQAKLFTASLTIKKDTIPDSTIIDYHLDIAGKSKFRDSVRFQGLTKFFTLAHFTGALIEALSMPLSDGVLQISENIVFSGPVPLGKIGGIQEGRIPFGNAAHDLTSNEAFHYVDSTGTLYVQNIVIGDGSFEEFLRKKSFKKISSDYSVEDTVETIFVDTTQRQIKIDLHPTNKEGKILFIKRTKGNHKFYAGNYKVKDNIKLIWDGEQWFKL